MRPERILVLIVELRENLHQKQAAGVVDQASVEEFDFNLDRNALFTKFRHVRWALEFVFGPGEEAETLLALAMGKEGDQEFKRVLWHLAEEFDCDPRTISNLIATWEETVAA